MSSVTVGDDASDGRNNESAVRLTDLLEHLGSVKWRVAAITLAGAAVSLAVALKLPRYYVATTLLLPSQQQGGMNNSPIAQLSSIAGVAGGGLSNKSNDELFIALMRSRNVLGAITKKFGLIKHYQVESDLDAQKILMSRTYVSSDKRAGLLTLTVEDVDPKLAAAIANDYLIQLERLNSTISITEAQRRRAFFEGQVLKAKSKLNAAEIRFARLQKEKGFLMADVLAEAGVKGSVEVRQQIATREVQLSVLQQFATNDNPEAKRISAELAALRQKQSKLERGRVSNSDVSAEAMDAVNAYRDVKVYSAALEGLVRQLELSRLDEAKDTPTLQQIDSAMEPQYPSKPSRANIVLAGTMLSFIFATFLVMATYTFGRIKSDRWNKVIASWGFVGKI